MKRITSQVCLLVILCFFSQNARALIHQFKGSGKAADPYVISQSEEWNWLVDNVSQGFTYSDSYFKLSDDWDNSNEPVVLAYVATSPSLEDRSLPLEALTHLASDPEVL